MRRSNSATLDKVEWLTLLGRHAGAGLWDVVPHEGNPMHSRSRWTFSGGLRALCGCEDAAAFPDTAQAFSDRLHPEDRAAMLEALRTALATGGTIDLPCRLRVRDGSFRWFRAAGGVSTQAGSAARRASGSLVDIHAARQAQEDRQASGEALVRRFHDDFASVIGKYTATGAQLDQDVREMSDAAEQTAARAMAVAAASGQASGNVQRVASATQELTASIGEITQQVARSARATTSATAEAEVAIEAVRTLVDDVRQIGDVVSLISNVAGQTNLLALNATIEAARAGEAGKGFAVVASEVKALAGQTGRATENIASRIQAVQKATTRVEHAIASVANIIAQLGEAASTIAAAVEEQGATTSEIARSIQQAASSTEQASSGMEQVNALAVRASEASGRVITSREISTAEAGKVRAHVAGFLDALRAG